ncbi:hypothetical protein SK128_017829 [Halocaridina rubra]|uniref:Integrin alpha-2 domain-containing protein n=1 Tax=Halocaridina rubra TaxID=373956 RepID=A0AAN9A730_HALRR
MISPISAFNLEPQSAKIFTDPTMEQSYWGRQSYFGFSVSLQRNTHNDGKWLVVGAPRANSSQYSSSTIPEPGAIFRCDLIDNQSTCIELRIDQSGNTYSPSQQADFSYYDLKNEGWLGGAMDSQPTYQEGRQATGVCAPRWINQVYIHYNAYQMNGACYWFNDSLADAPAHKKLPLIQYSKQTITENGRSVFYFSHGQAGLSIHFPDDPTQMIVGAPGVFNWQGSVIRFKDADSQIPGQISVRRRRRRRRQLSSKPESHMFSSELVPNPSYTAGINDFDLNGYAVTSGRFYSKDELLYASGAPRGAYNYGKVFIFNFPETETRPFSIRAEWQGTQIGENFGASLAAADVNGDGLSDLIAGSPMFSKPSKPDMGRMQVFLSTKVGTMVQSDSYYGSSVPSARFATTLAMPGDLNHDGYEDIAVGAPYEDDDRGAVYIYLGSETGLRQSFAQRLSPSDFSSAYTLLGFGMAISRGIDMDNNEYPDLAIGSFMSGHAMVLRSRTVASVKGELTSDPSTLLLDNTYLQLVRCITYKGHKVPQQVNIRGNITLDYGHPSPRASFRDTGGVSKDFNIVGVKEESICDTHDVDVKTNKIDPRRPILIRLEHMIIDSQGDIMSQPITDPGEPKITTLPISIVTECESDGDKTCHIDMRVEAKFLNYRVQDKLIIGEDNRPVVEITVHNLGESVFLPNVTVTVPEPFALFLPTTHDCAFTVKDNRTAMVCHLTNPIKRDKEDTVRVTIDASRVTDTTNEMRVKIKAAGEGVEIEPSDDSLTEMLLLSAQAELKLHGSSREEQIIYHSTGEGKINTTIQQTSFTHHYNLIKSGPTPIEKVNLTIDIPVNFTNENFIAIYAPETNFLGQPFICNVEGISLAVKSDKREDERINTQHFSGADNKIPITKGVVVVQNSGHAARVGTSDDSSQDVHSFQCRGTEISCARLRCQINSWPSGINSAELSFRMDVNFTVLASHISARGGAIVSSTATAAIASLNPNLTFMGIKETTTDTDTHFLPASLAGRGVAWWIILLAVLGGLLLLTLIAYGLYKMGFFKRKKYQEMMNKARQETNANALED